MVSPQTTPRTSRRWVIALAFTLLSMTFAGCLGSDDVESPDETGHDDHTDDVGHGNETAGNQTGGNATTGNGTTSGNAGDNSTAGNDTDGNTTTGNTTTGNSSTSPKLPEPVEGRWAGKIAIGKTTEHMTESWSFGDDPEEKINVTLTITLSIEKAEVYEALATGARINIELVDLEGNKINSGSTPSVGGVVVYSPAETNFQDPTDPQVDPNDPKAPEQGPVVVTYTKQLQTPGTYTLSLDGRGVDTPYVAEMLFEYGPVA